MIMGTMSFAAFAADPVDRKIAVTGLETGDKVNFYKVLAWAGDKTTEEQTTLGAVSGWYPLAPFKTVLTPAVLKAAINEDNELMLTDELAGELARALNGASATPVNGTTPISESGKKAEYVFAAQDPDSTAADGLYMAIVTPKDQNTVYNPIFVHLDNSTDDDSFAPTKTGSYYKNEGVAKKSTVTLTKDFKNDNDYNGDSGDTTKPGDKLSFTVDTTIPGYGDMYIAPAFKITDQMNGLALDPSTLAIKIKGGDAIAEANYTKTATADGYTIDFKSEYLKTLNVATDIEITYDATVKEGANTNVIKEKNTVTVEFSHDPTTETDGKPGGDKQFKKDITNHYTFSIDANNLVGPSSDRIGESGSEIIKVGVDKDGKPIIDKKTYSNVTTNNYAAGPLAGAEFELLDKNKNSFDPKKTATSDANGRLNFTGLDAGTYYLKETKAPAGYVKNTNEVAIVIDATLETKTITEYYDQAGNWYNAPGTGRTEFKYETEELVSYTVTYGGQASTYTFDHEHEGTNDEIKWKITQSGETPQSIPNTKGVELPSTGGMGTTLFYMIGAVLVLGAGILLVTRRKVNSN